MCTGSGEWMRGRHDNQITRPATKKQFELVRFGLNGHGLGSQVGGLTNSSQTVTNNRKRYRNWGWVIKYSLFWSNGDELIAIFMAHYSDSLRLSLHRTTKTSRTIAEAAHTVGVIIRLWDSYKNVLSWATPSTSKDHNAARVPELISNRAH